MMTNAQRYAFSQFFCQRVFGYDAVFDLVGVSAESEAMGSKVTYSDTMTPSVTAPAIKDYATDLERLPIPNPYADGRLPLILKGIGILNELSKGEVPVIGYLQAPFRHACMLRGPENAMRDLFKNRSQMERLLEVATESLIPYGKALVKAGVDIIFITDPVASGDALSTRQWEQFAYPYLKRLIVSIKGTSAVKIILHICGDTSDRLETFASLGIDGMSLDEKVDLGYARKVMGDKICLIGNVSPSKTLYLGTTADVEEESRLCIEKAGRDGYFILCSGCMITGPVPPANIKAMVTAAEKYGRYD
jgi:uroporphyrinogen decarboxylase